MVARRVRVRVQVHPANAQVVARGIGLIDEAERALGPCRRPGARHAHRESGADQSMVVANVRVEQSDLAARAQVPEYDQHRQRSKDRREHDFER
jgi:hypothetical protein